MGRAVGRCSIRRNLKVEAVRGGYHHGLRSEVSVSIKYPAARCEHTCLTCYACRMCVLRRTSKLAKKPAGTKEERLNRTVTNVGNIYNLRPRGEHCYEVSLNLVVKSTTIHSLTSTLYPYTQGPELNSHLVTIAALLGLYPKLLLDAHPVLDLLLQQIPLIHEQDQRHLGQLRR
jgi:hypothetical protein